METSAANRVFCIPELLQLIVLELGSTRDLARMARVAHAAHLPSIQTLWSGASTRFYLGDELFSNLVQLLPEGLLQRMDAKSKWSLSRSPLASDWSCVRNYSIHAKALKIKMSDYTLDLFSFLNAAKPNLFPQLRKMELSDDVAFSSAEWTMLLVPTLRDLQLGDNFFARISLGDLASFCRQLSRCTSQLRRLALPATKAHGVTSKEGKAASNIVAAIKSLADLTELSWTWDCQLSKTVIKLLATHPRLSKIGLGRVEQRVGKLGAKETLFPCLADLQLFGTDVGMESVLNQLPHPESLTHIALQYTQLHYSTQFLALSSLCHAASLTSIFLEFNPDDVSWPDLEFDSLSPILGCRKVTDFTLSSMPRVEGLDDDAICLMAESWPELEDIFIYAGESTDEGDPYLRPSLSGLHSLAVLCPRLRRVTMSVMLTCCEYYDMVGDEEGACHQKSRTLESLDLFHSRWDDNWDCKHHIHPQATAKILRDIWPALKTNDIHIMMPPTQQDERLLFERLQQVKQCLAHMDQEQAIAQRDSVISSMQERQNKLEAECARLRQALAAGERGSASRV